MAHLRPFFNGQTKQWDCEVCLAYRSQLAFLQQQVADAEVKIAAEHDDATREMLRQAQRGSKVRLRDVQQPRCYGTPTTGSGAT